MGGQEKVGKEKSTRGSCIARQASDVPFATCRPRAGANSAIPGLGHRRLVPSSGCVAWLEPREFARTNNVVTRHFESATLHQSCIALALALALAVASARTMRAERGPSLAARLHRNCPQDGPHDVGQFAASTGRCCQRTPQQTRVPEAHGLCAGRQRGVVFSLVTFS